MFFVRKAAEPIGRRHAAPGKRCRQCGGPFRTRPLPAQQASAPSGRARHRHNKCPPKAHFGRSGETATCLIEASRMRFDFHFSSYARFVSVRQRVSCARMSQIEVSLQFLLFWVLLHPLPERQAFFVDTNRLKLENNGVENEHERSSDR